MPQQVSRLLIVFSLLVIALLVARRLLVPPTFGEYGHYRAAAMDTVAAHPAKYAGMQTCGACHRPIADKRLSGNHRTVACESCHGPAVAHTNAPLETKPVLPQGRDFCVKCHAYNPSRPTGFPQIDPVAHNPVIPCKTCHDPHAPVPPVTPEGCGGCHGEIARQKAVSRHAPLPCTMCHQAPDEHKINPRAVRPTKPTARDFCGTCHASGVQGGIPQIDLRTHGVPYVCWQCHYPHSPETE